MPGSPGEGVGDADGPGRVDDAAGRIECDHTGIRRDLRRCPRAPREIDAKEDHARAETTRPSLGRNLPRAHWTLRSRTRSGDLAHPLVDQGHAVSLPSPGAAS